MDDSKQAVEGGPEGATTFEVISRRSIDSFYDVPSTFLWRIFLSHFRFAVSQQWAIVIGEWTFSCIDGLQASAESLRMLEWVGDEGKKPKSHNHVEIETKGEELLHQNGGCWVLIDSVGERKRRNKVEKGERKFIEEGNRFIPRWDVLISTASLTYFYFGHWLQTRRTQSSSCNWALASCGRSDNQLQQDDHLENEQKGMKYSKSALLFIKLSSFDDLSFMFKRTQVKEICFFFRIFIINNTSSCSKNLIESWVQNQDENRNGI